MEREREITWKVGEGEKKKDEYDKIHCTYKKFSKNKNKLLYLNIFKEH